MSSPLVIRWTVGNVHRSGFETLKLSILGARRLFGASASYVICVNTVPVDEARRRTGELPGDIEWRPVVREDIARFIRPYLDGRFAEGTGWKFAPFRLDVDRAELALDNDCILWDLPDALREWAAGRNEAVVAEDVRACFGQFAPLCGSAPRNSGIRAIPSGYDLEARIRKVLECAGVTEMTSELDEQGLQVAALSLDAPPDVVHIDEVSICSPFPPHLAHPGTCGVHFVGVNARWLPWSYEGRSGVAHIQDHWRRWRGETAARVGVSEMPSSASFASGT